MKRKIILVFTIFVILNLFLGCSNPSSISTEDYRGESTSATPTNGKKLTEEELIPTFDLSMTIKSEADFDTVVWFTEWENGKDGKLVAAWEYIIPAKKTTTLFLNEKATKKKYFYRF